MVDATPLAARMSRLGTEATFAVMARARVLEAEGRTVYQLAVGEPDFETPPHIVEAGADALRRGFTRYVAAPGLPEVREAAGEFLGRTGRPRYPASRIVITPGAKPIMFYSILALCEEGDEVLYPDPGFPMYASITAFAGATPVPVPLREDNGFRVAVDDVAARVTDRTRLLILNSPQNPCGSALEWEDVEALAELALERGFFVLSDEIYWAFRYRGEHVSIASVDGMRDRTILLDGCSKTFAMTGWRLGFGALPPHLVEPVTRLIINSVSCTPAFAQVAMLAALTGPRTSVEQMVQQFHKRRDLLVKGLNRIPGVSCIEPVGAFYAFPNVRTLNASSERVAAAFLERAGVACLPGTAFGAAGEGHLRISFASPVRTIRDALVAMEAALPGIE